MAGAGMELHAQMQAQMETQMQTLMQMDMKMLTTSKTKNPVRPVIHLLEDLLNKNKKQEAEEAELEKKRACDCEAELRKQKAIVDDLGKGLPELEEEYKNLHAEVHMLKLDTRLAQRRLAELALELKDLKEMFEKQIAVKEKELKDFETNMNAMKSAIDVLRKGLGAKGSAFLQTSTAAYLRNLIGDEKADMSDSDRDTLGAFLADDADRADAYKPGTEEIIGILRQMGDTMYKNYALAKSDFSRIYRQYMKLRQLKEQEIEDKKVQISAMTTRSAELMKRLVEVENLIKDILTMGYFREKALYEAMLKACELGKQIHEKRRILRAEEASAITHAIKLLSSDEALELFKKVLPAINATDQKATDFLLSPPGPSQSTTNQPPVDFLQVKASAREKALAALMETRGKHRDPRIDFIAFLLLGKKIDMTKVTTMIDDLVKVLSEYQDDDLKKKEECDKNFADAQLERMRLMKELGPIGPLLDQLRAQLKEAQEGIDRLTPEITELEKRMDELTEKRTAEKNLYMKEAALDTAAYDLLRVAKQRLTNFYGSFLQIHMAQTPGDSTSNPATQNGQEVLQVLGKIASDLKQEVEADKLVERQQQEAYENEMRKIRDAREGKIKMIDEYKDQRAECNLRIDKHTDENRELVEQLMQHDEYIQSLHKDCDWLLANYDSRKAARAGEIESLNKAKMVLNGAEFDGGENTTPSLIQEKAAHRPVSPLLRGSTSA